MESEQTRFGDVSGKIEGKSSVVPPNLSSELVDEECSWLVFWEPERGEELVGIALIYDEVILALVLLCPVHGKFDDREGISVSEIPYSIEVFFSGGMFKEGRDVVDLVSFFGKAFEDFVGEDFGTTGFGVFDVAP